MITNQKVFAVSLLVCLSPLVSAAQKADVPGSKDHSLISRYPGSVITEYTAKEYDEFLLPLGKLDSGTGKFAKSQHLEGKVTRIYYEFPPNRSVLEVFRNYEGALKTAGFQTLFSCVNEECGYGNFRLTSDKAEAWNAANERQLSAKLSRAKGDAYLSLHVRGQGAQLDIIEIKPMDRPMEKPK